MIAEVNSNFFAKHRDLLSPSRVHPLACLHGECFPDLGAAQLPNHVVGSKEHQGAVPHAVIGCSCSIVTKLTHLTSDNPLSGQSPS
jgi:hypothetical protein